MFFRVFFAVVAGVIGLIAAAVAGLALVDVLRFARFWLGARTIDESPFDGGLSRRFDKKLTPEEEQAAMAELWAQACATGLSRRKLAAFRALVDRAGYFSMPGHGWRVWLRAWCRVALEAPSPALRREALAVIVREVESNLHRLWPGDLDRLAALPIDELARIELKWAQRHVEHWRFRPEARRRLEALAGRPDWIGREALDGAVSSALEAGEGDHALELWARLRGVHPGSEYVPGQLRQRFAPESDVLASLGPLRVVHLKRVSAASLRLTPLRAPSLASPRALLGSPPAPASGARGEPLPATPLPMLALPLGLGALVAFRMPRARGAFEVEMIGLPDPSRRWLRCMNGEELADTREREVQVNFSLDAVLSLTEQGASLWVIDRDTGAPVADLPVTFWVLTDPHRAPLLLERRTGPDGLVALRDLAFWQVGAFLRREAEHGSEEFLFLTHDHEISTAAPPCEEDRLYFWLARPLYRPGEVLQGKLIARRKGSSRPSLRWLADRSVTVDVRGPRGSTLATLHLKLSRFGTASFAVPIPADTTLGRHAFVVREPHGTRFEGGFFVEEFVAPEFRASLRAVGDARWGAGLELAFEASYFFGGPVADAEGVVELRRVGWSSIASSSWPPLRRFAEEQTLAPLRFRTDAAGKAALSLPWQGPADLLRRLDGFELLLRATVRDASGKTCEAQLSLSFGRCSHAALVTPEHAIRMPGEPLPLALKWHPPPSAEPVEHELIVTFQKGLSFERRRLRVSTHDARVVLPQGLAPGEWKIHTRLAGQRRPSQGPGRLLVPGEALSSAHPSLLVSKGELAEGEPLSIALRAPRGPLSALLVYNRGPVMRSLVLTSRGTSAQATLAPLAGKGSQLHVQAWLLAPGELQPVSAVVALPPPEPDLPPAAALALAFPAEAAPPGSVTSLAIDAPGAAEVEVACTVVDEALFSLVPAPRSPLEFFEEPPASPAPAPPAWSARYAGAQSGRRVPYFFAQADLGHALPFAQATLDDLSTEGGLAEEEEEEEEEQAEEPFEEQSKSAPMAAPSMAAAPMAAAPMAAPRPSAKPRSMTMAGAARMTRGARMQESKADVLELSSGGGGAPEEPPVVVRSDFSSEAAFVPALALRAGGGATVSVVLPETLTTWKATALALTLDDRMGEAEARISTRKELMVRLQMPRFFQERDRLSLRALVDSRAAVEVALRATLEAPALGVDAAFERPLPAGGQARVEVEVQVPAVEGGVRVRAVARAGGLPADAEEREVPFRPYGSPVFEHRQGTLSGAEERVELRLPAARKVGRSRLRLHVDRGPLDAVQKALSYLLEYPYGCVEQTCSRLLPNLVWERVIGRHEGEGYRGSLGPSSERVEEGIRGLLSAQNGDGGFGWWPGRGSDVWMTAYVVFTFAISGRSDAALGAASRFLRARLLDAGNPDDADAFAAFALAFRGEVVERRVADVLLPRWDSLSLTEQVKLCLPLMTAGHPEAGERVEALKRRLVKSARRFVQKVEDGAPDGGAWFNPRSTEAIAFFVLVLLRDPDEKHGEALDLLAAFLLLHRSGSRWFSTRDTALAVLALLALDERQSRRQASPALRVALDGRELLSASLGKQAVSLSLGDEALPAEGGRLVLATEGVTDAALSRRHYSVEIEFFSQEDRLAPRSQGLSIERVYWLLDDRGKRSRRLDDGARVTVGQRLRVVLRAKAEKPRRYLLIEDPKLAGCEPLAKKSGPEVCEGDCEHVELRADRTAIFLGSLGGSWVEVSYEIEAQLTGQFSAMPARIETMYESECSGSSGSFSLLVAP